MAGTGRGAGNHGDGPCRESGRIPDEALTALGWTDRSGQAVVASLKTERARMPDKPGQTPHR